MKSKIDMFHQIHLSKELLCLLLVFASVFAEYGIISAMSPLWNVFSETYPPSTPLVFIIIYYVLPMFLILIGFFVAFFILPAIAINAMECLWKERGSEHD